MADTVRRSVEQGYKSNFRFSPRSNILYYMQGKFDDTSEGDSDSVVYHRCESTGYLRSRIIPQRLCLPANHMKKNIALVSHLEEKSLFFLECGISCPSCPYTHSFVAVPTFSRKLSSCYLSQHLVLVNRL